MTVRREFVTSERADLADTFIERGPDEPTLCEGWQTRDLLEHLVIRDAGPLRAAASGWKEQVRQADWSELVDRFRAGPPAGSPFRFPGADAAANGEEFFVHHEDVRRASAGWVRRELPGEVEDALWRRLRSPFGKLAVRHADVGIHIQRLDATGERGEHTMLRRHRPVVAVCGQPSELLLFLFGRQRAAVVDLYGAEDAREALAGAKLGM